MENRAGKPGYPNIKSETGFLSLTLYNIIYFKINFLCPFLEFKKNIFIDS
jgi:hypothetical protein